MARARQVAEDHAKAVIKRHRNTHSVALGIAQCFADEEVRLMAVPAPSVVETQIQMSLSGKAVSDTGATAIPIGVWQRICKRDDGLTVDDAGL